MSTKYHHTAACSFPCGMGRRIREKKKFKTPNSWAEVRIIIIDGSITKGERNKPQGKQEMHNTAQALPGAEENLLNRQVRGC